MLCDSINPPPGIYDHYCPHNNQSSISRAHNWSLHCQPFCSVSWRQNKVEDKQQTRANYCGLFTLTRTSHTTRPYDSRSRQTIICASIGDTLSIFCSAVLLHSCTFVLLSIQDAARCLNLSHRQPAHHIVSCAQCLHPTILAGRRCLGRCNSSCGASLAKFELN